MRVDRKTVLIYCKQWLGHPIMPTINTSSGFTFLEVMVALAITAGLLVTVIGTLNYHLGLVENQREITIAAMLAKEKLMALKKDPRQEKGTFSEPYERFGFETTVKESNYPFVYEIAVRITSNRELIILSELVQKR